jgi:3-isopropylmalate/(R)-2-methylmalate dehydratase small subunit
VWALDDAGFRSVIAPSFADIFFNNSFKSGFLPIVLSEEKIEQLFQEVEAEENYQLAIDLEQQTITTPSGEKIAFDIDPFRKYCLLHGLDDIGLTLQNRNTISSYEEKRRREAPWLFA